jgi:hypothetical protein
MGTHRHRSTKCVSTDKSNIRNKDRDSEMPIIKKVKKIDPKQVSFKIDAGLAAQLTRYSEYTNVPVWEIVSTAIKHVIDSDQEFLKLPADQFVVEKKVKRKLKEQPKAA